MLVLLLSRFPSLAPSLARAGSHFRIHKATKDEQEVGHLAHVQRPTHRLSIHCRMNEIFLPLLDLG